jgi:hypothetical protein
VLRSDKISSMLFSSNEKYYFQHMWSTVFMRCHASGTECAYTVDTRQM